MGRRGTAAKPLPSKLAALLPALLLAALLAACNGEAPPEEAKQEETSKPEAAGPPQKPSLLLEPVAFADLPGWAEDDVSAALPALKRSCGRLSGQPDGRPLGPGGLAGTVADWQSPCAALQPASDRKRPRLNSRPSC